jgi:acid stress-induced BolA-like protein IbaG/YrbA
MGAPALTRKVRRLLTEGFPGARVDVGTAVPSATRVGGVVVSDVFDGQDHVDRQRAVWRVLRAGLTEGELEQVGLILPVTEAEFEPVPFD